MKQPHPAIVYERELIVTAAYFRVAVWAGSDPRPRQILGPYHADPSTLDAYRKAKAAADIIEDRRDTRALIYAVHRDGRSVPVIVYGKNKNLPLYWEEIGQTMGASL